MKNLLLTIIASALLTGVAQADIPAAPAPAQGTPPAAAHGHHDKAARKEMREKFKAEKEAMKEKIQTACSADAATAGCAQEHGKGLMKCIHEYKKSHADFKLSEGCMQAAHEGQAMRHERKMTRKSWKDKKDDSGTAPAAPAAPPTAPPAENK